MQPSITLEYTEDGTLLDRMDAVREAGFSAVNLFSGVCKQLMQSTTENAEVLKTQLSERGLAVDWVHAPYVHSVLYEKDPEISSVMIGALKTAVRIGAEMNAVSLVVHPLNLSYPEHVDENLTLDQLVHSFTALTKYAKEHDIYIAVENIDEPYSTNILKTLFEEVPDLKFCFDTGHANHWQTFDIYLPKYANRITALHIHDNHGETDEHLIPGDGTIDYSPLLEALSANECCNYLGIECVQRIGKYSGGCFDLPFKIRQNMERITNG